MPRSVRWKTLGPQVARYPGRYIQSWEKLPKTPSKSYSGNNTPCKQQCLPVFDKMYFCLWLIQHMHGTLKVLSVQLKFSCHKKQGYEVMRVFISPQSLFQNTMWYMINTCNLYLSIKLCVCVCVSIYKSFSDFTGLSGSPPNASLHSLPLYSSNCKLRMWLS